MTSNMNSFIRSESGHESNDDLDSALGPEILDLNNWVGANRMRTQRERARVQADKNLTEQGKAARLAELDAAARAKHEELLQKRKAAIETRRRELYRTAFAIYGGNDVYRDVYGRAMAADPKGLEQMALQADRTNDRTLMRAVWQSAYDRNIPSLLEDAPSDVHRLLNFERALGERAPSGESRSVQLTRKFAERVRNSGL